MVHGRNILTLTNEQFKEICQQEATLDLIKAYMDALETFETTLKETNKIYDDLLKKHKLKNPNGTDVKYISSVASLPKSKELNEFNDELVEKLKEAGYTETYKVLGVQVLPGDIQGERMWVAKAALINYLSQWTDIQFSELEGRVWLMNQYLEVVIEKATGKKFEISY